MRPFTGGRGLSGPVRADLAIGIALPGIVFPNRAHFVRIMLCAATGSFTRQAACYPPQVSTGLTGQPPRTQDAASPSMRTLCVRLHSRLSVRSHLTESCEAELTRYGRTSDHCPLPRHGCERVSSGVRSTSRTEHHGDASIALNDCLTSPIHRLAVSPHTLAD